MNRHVRPPKLMSFDEFVAFVDKRPDEEKWELLEGHAVMSPTPVDPHQIVLKNLTIFFGLIVAPRPGLGTSCPASPCMSRSFRPACRSPMC